MARTSKETRAGTPIKARLDCGVRPRIQKWSGRCATYQHVLQVRAWCYNKKTRPYRPYIALDWWGKVSRKQICAYVDIVEIAFLDTYEADFLKAIFFVRPIFLVLNFCKKKMGQKPTKNRKMNQKGKDCKFGIFAFKKPNLAQSLKNFAPLYDRTVAPFRSSNIRNFF